MTTKKEAPSMAATTQDAKEIGQSKDTTKSWVKQIFVSTTTTLEDLSLGLHMEENLCTLLAQTMGAEVSEPMLPGRVAMLADSLYILADHIHAMKEKAQKDVTQLYQEGHNHFTLKED